MTRIEFDYDHFELLNLETRIRADGEATKNELKAAMVQAVKAAHDVMIAEAPKDDGDMLSHAVISFGGFEYRPGGFGGGGDYAFEVSVGIDEAAVPHVRFVFEGTGIYGPHHHRIEPAHGNLMDFIDDRGRWTVRSTKGQRPQQEWVENAMRAAETVLDSLEREAGGGPSITAIPR